MLAPLSGDVVTLLALRFLGGVGLGAVPAIALAYLSEEIDAAHTAAATGSYIAGATIGGLVGRILAGSIIEVGGWQCGVVTAAGVCVVAALVATRSYENLPAQRLRCGRLLRVESGKTPRKATDMR
ncbi:MFS transporter [Microbacterium sp. W4I20]|uniref:MFS transporter n=1 Tax=Microbacterium sp. W4I20 TaxID=3042262 RepID=UPI0027D8199B|nr:MFS transporter [Microbacterium sp. W4I20]